MVVACTWCGKSAARFTTKSWTVHDARTQKPIHRRCKKALDRFLEHCHPCFGDCGSMRVFNGACNKCRRNHRTLWRHSSALHRRACTPLQRQGGRTLVECLVEDDAFRARHLRPGVRLTEWVQHVQAMWAHVTALEHALGEAGRRRLAHVVRFGWTDTRRKKGPGGWGARAMASDWTRAMALPRTLLRKRKTAPATPASPAADAPETDAGPPPPRPSVGTRAGSPSGSPRPAASAVAIAAPPGRLERGPPASPTPRCAPGCTGVRHGTPSVGCGNGRVPEARATDRRRQRPWRP